MAASAQLQDCFKQSGLAAVVPAGQDVDPPQRLDAELVEEPKLPDPEFFERGLGPVA